MRFPSEGKPQRTLHHPGRTRRNNLAEQRVRLNARGRQLSRCVHRSGLRVIENVASFPSERKISLLILQREVLGDSHVVVVDARLPHIVLARITFA